MMMRGLAGAAAIGLGLYVAAQRGKGGREAGRRRRDRGGRGDGTGGARSAGDGAGAGVVGCAAPGEMAGGARSDGNHAPRQRRYQRFHSSWLRCEVVVAGNEEEYRRCVRLVSRSDNVLELGCHEGVTTRRIAKRGCKLVVGLDTSKHNITRAKIRSKSECSSAVCEVGDASDVSNALKLIRELGGAQNPITVVFLDVSGNRSPSFLLPLIEAYDKAIKPRLICVKSFKIENFLRKSRLSTDIDMGQTC